MYLIQAQPSPLALLLVAPDQGSSTNLAIAGAVLVCLVLVAWFTFLNARQLYKLRRELDPVRQLDAIEQHLARLVGDEGSPELRRVEHVLVDIRDGQKRFEERIVSLTESQGRAASAGEAPIPGAGLSHTAGLAERVVTRLLAMGFERIEVLSSTEEQAKLLEEGGSLVVEARRGGSLHKGRVSIENGGIASVQLRSAFQAFP
ncbi:MAG: hypothetical protein ACI8QC_004138 [Planctomycetota bacterium]|jgi:hypothetical protein